MLQLSLAGLSHVRWSGSPVQLHLPEHDALPAAHAHLRSLVHGQLLQGGEQLCGQFADRLVGRLIAIYLLLYTTLSGQRDKPFVNDEENNLRTPRPDLLDRPYAPDYAGESFRSQYKVSLLMLMHMVQFKIFAFASN